MIAGFGWAELTPPLGIELSGYGYYLTRRAEYVLDKLYARALYVATKDVQWMLIACDTLGLRRDVVEAVYEGLAGYGLKRESIMLVSTHTHTGPVLNHLEGCGEAKEAYIATVSGNILRACAQAVQDARGVQALFRHNAQIKGGFVYNRADQEGPVDDRVRGFSFVREGAERIAVPSFACHPVFCGRISAVSADYPGMVNQILQEKGFASLYINGACGDIDPHIHAGDDPAQKLSECAEAICDAFVRHKTPISATLQTFRIPFRLRIADVTAAEIHAAAQGAVGRSGEASGEAQVAKIWAQQMLARFKSLPAEEDIEIAAACLGGAWIFALPFETFTQTGCLVREQGGGEEAIVLGCAEEPLGYLPTREDIIWGKYASLEAMFIYKRPPPVLGEAERLGEWLGRVAAKERLHKNDASNEYPKAES